jgi:hypothetical protein
MKIALYTCNFGNYRNEFNNFYNKKNIFDKNIDYFLFTEKTICEEEYNKLNGWNICNVNLLEKNETMDANRLTSKYIKFLLPEKLKNYDIIVWVDSKIINDNNVMKNLTYEVIINLFQSHKNNLIFNFKHPIRETMQQELKVTIQRFIENKESGEKFLNYIKNYTSKFDLPNTCLIIRKNISIVNEAFEHCFMLMNKNKLKRDQNIYNYALDQKEITPIMLDFCNLEKHKF